jgi:hypothetical protein
MGGNSIYSLLSDPQGRHSLVSALMQASAGNPEDSVLSYLSQGLADESYIFPLSQAEEQKIQNIIDSSDKLSSLQSSAAIFAAQAPAQNIQKAVVFVPRGERDTLRQFIDKNLNAFGLGKDVPRETRGILIEDFLEHTGINFGSVKYWGEKEGGGFREPKDLVQTLKVYEWLDRQASLKGMRVDFWDFLACIYPRVSKMIARSDSAGQIIVRIPNFMDDVPFHKINYMTFAQKVINNKLASRLADSTVYGHARGRSKKPLWKIIDAYADSISEEAAGDEDERIQRRQIFDFLVFVRLTSLIGNIVPARDIADRPVTSDKNGNPITKPLDRYPTRFTLRVVPESEVVEYISFGDTSRFNIQRWPFRNLAGGQFDLMLDIMEARIETFENFSYILENSPLEISNIRRRFDKIRERHAAYKNAFLNPEKNMSADTQKYLNEIRKFYRDFNRFFEETVFFSHARGSIMLGELALPFEIVPKINGIDVSPVAHGRVSVFAEDIIRTAKKEAWPPQEISNTFLLRLLSTWQIASGVVKKDVLEDPEKIVKMAGNFDLGISEAEVKIAASRIFALHKAAMENEGISIDPTLHRVLHLRTTGSSQLHEYYVYDYASHWLDQLRSFYENNGYGEDEIQSDSKIAEDYFKVVRHPHYIFNKESFYAKIAEIYTGETERAEAAKRLLAFFTYINVRTNPAPRHPVSIDESGAVLKVIEWAFQDYLENFPGAGELGAQIEINDKLILEITDRQIAEHPEMTSRRGVIKRGLRAAIENFNQGRTRSISQIADEFKPLPKNGIFPERFDAFMKNWGRENQATLALDRQKLLSAFSLIKNGEPSYVEVEKALLKQGIDEDFLKENTQALYDWLLKLHHEMKLFDQYADTDIAAQYIKENYSAPLISAKSLSKIIREYLVRRLTTPQPVDVEALIAAEIAGRFDPYPTIKAEVVSFYHMLVRKYLNYVYTTLMQKYNRAIEAIDAATDELMNDKLFLMFRGLTFNDFEGKVLQRLDFIHPEYKEIPPIISAADGINGGAAGTVIKAQYHPSPKRLNEFYDQVVLMALAAGEETVESLETENHIESFEKHIADNFEYLLAAVEIIEQERQTKIRRDQEQLLLMEAPIKKFWERVQESLKIIVADYNPDEMNADETKNAIAAIEQGLETVWNLKDELNGEIKTLAGQARQLASDIGATDDTSGLLEQSEKLITETENKLLRQHEELEFRLEEIKEEEQLALDKMVEAELIAEETRIREEAEARANQLISGAGTLVKQMETFAADARKASSKLSRLKEEIISLLGTGTERASSSIDIFRNVYSLMIEYQSHADEIRGQLNGLRSSFDVTAAEKMHRDIKNLLDENVVSDQVRTQLWEARKKLMSASSDAGTHLEEAESVITSLGGPLKTLKTKLEEKETMLPLPELVLPHQVDKTPLSRQLSFNNSALSFNTSNFNGMPSGKLSRAQIELERIRLLAAGENSYLVNTSAANAVKVWIAEGRSGSLQLKDIFGTDLVIPAGSLGVRVLDRENGLLTERHPLIKLTLRISYILSVKSYESDFVVRLMDVSKSNDSALSIWRQFIAGIINEDIDNETDARLFVRRFAVSKLSELVAIRPFAKCRWFEPIKTPLRVTLSGEEYKELSERPLEKINEVFFGIQGSAEHSKNREAALLFSAALKPYLSSSALAWWTQNEADIPESLGILWRLITDSHEEQKRDDYKFNLRLSLLADLADYLDELNQNGPGLSSMDIGEMSRFALKFLMENIVAIKFGKIMYDENGRLLYHPAEHAELARIFKMRIEHPEFKTLRFEGQKIGVFGNGSIVVKPGEFDRIVSAATGGGPLDMTVTHYNWRKKEFETAAILMNGDNIYIGALPEDDAALKYAKILFIIHSNPRLMGLGFIIADIIKYKNDYAQAYSKMLVLLERYHEQINPMLSKYQSIDDTAADKSITALLLKMEAEMTAVYPPRPAAPDTGTGSSAASKTGSGRQANTSHCTSRPSQTSPQTLLTLGMPLPASIQPLVVSNPFFIMPLNINLLIR